MEFEPGEYDACTYCGRSIFPGVVQCPYCKEATDGKGPLGLEREQKPRLPKIFVIAGWLLLAALLFEIVLQLYYAVGRMR